MAEPHTPSKLAAPRAVRAKTWGGKPLEVAPRSTVSAKGEVSIAVDVLTTDVAAAGDVIVDRYLLTSLLGEGGMGAVWLARDLRLEIDVALKFLRRDMATSTSSERLLQEARAVARLDHPSIVRVFDFGISEAGDPFLAMEVLRGELLAEVLERKVRLAAPNAVCTLLPIASAVAAAHAKGIVHRDIKPENILLVTDDSGSVVPKVLDFGIAKLRDQGRKVARITQDHAIVGTPDYMPPEQASGVGEVDARADIWALCVVLYEAISGRRPFEGQTPPLVLIAIATQDPIPTTEFAAGDDALWRILERGLQKEAKDRWQTMRDFGAALARSAVDNGADTDVAGTSLTVHWLAEGQRRPLSEAPSAQWIVKTAGGHETAPDLAIELDTGGGRGSAPTPDGVAAPGEGVPAGVATWPPRPINRMGAEQSLLSAVAAEVELPPELKRGRRRWVWVVLLLAGGAALLYSARNTREMRYLWDEVRDLTGQAPAPSTEASAGEPSTQATTEPAPPPTAQAKPPASVPAKTVPTSVKKPPPGPLPTRPKK